MQTIHFTHNEAAARAVAERYATPPLAYVHSYGCQQNVSDGEHLKGVLLDIGYGLCNSPENADLILFNTCAVREHAEQRVFGNVGALKRLKEQKPELIIGLCGCMVQQPRILDKLRASYPFVDLAFGTNAIDQLPELLLEKWRSGGKRLLKAPVARENIVEEIPVHRESTFRGWLPIMYGCDNFCTYCIVPYVRGHERSRSPQDVLDEFRGLVASGCKEITLLGQNVNSYNFEYPDGRKVDFPSLLGMVADAAPDMRIRFTTSHPKDMSDETIAVIASRPNICRHIHLPVQSGSDRVLRSMNRKYTREWYLGRIAAIRAAIPDCGISTDLFTGFHDETEEDFQETLSLMREVGFDSSFMFKYSERPGTLAARTMPDNVPEDVKIDRLNRMIALQNELSLESNRRDVGKEFDVLVESVSKRSKEQFVGRNSQNKAVVLPRGDYRVGDTVRVRVVSASSATLIAELA